MKKKLKKELAGLKKLSKKTKRKDEFMSVGEWVDLKIEENQKKKSEDKENSS
ncbi:MAG: hypothetical protein RI573_04385 [Balneolaceae bacterium]|nr:hypothetical protein [Balneolaceae bacterium]